MEVEARKIADMLDFRKSQDKLLVMDYSGENGESITKILNPYINDLSFVPEGKVEYNKFLSYGWLSNFGLTSASLKKGLALSLSVMKDKGLMLFYDVQDEYLSFLQRELETQGIEQIYIFNNEILTQNATFNAVLAKVEKY